MSNDVTHDIQLHAMSHPQHDLLTHREHRPVSPGRADALERDGYLPSLQIENYRLLGAGASYFSVVPNNRSAPEGLGSPFTADIGIWPSLIEERQPKRKRRLTRRAPSARRLTPRTHHP